MKEERKRVFLIVMDSFGIGEASDAADFSDEGSNTLKSIYSSPFFKSDYLAQLGLFHIDGNDYSDYSGKPKGSFARLAELSKGKDTTIGHWEIAGVVSHQPLPTYPNGFPKEVLDELSKRTGRGILCNLPYSGTDVIRDYGDEHIRTGKLIVYTSADSVLQIAAHEDVIPVKQLYEYCEIARKILTGEHSVGRVIARPFIGESGSFSRTSNRHDFSLLPPRDTMLDKITAAGMQTIGVGKIFDIFAGKGIQRSLGVNKDNKDGMEKTMSMLQEEFEGLCFVNLVDFDMVYGHRNDVDGYAKAVSEFDSWLGLFLEELRADDLLIITADHGCDPATPSTDHSRECVPMLIYGFNIKAGINLGRREGFGDIAATVLDYLGIKDYQGIDGTSFLKEVFLS